MIFYFFISFKTLKTTFFLNQSNTSVIGGEYGITVLSAWQQNVIAAFHTVPLVLPCLNTLYTLRYAMYDIVFYCKHKN